MAKFTLKYEHKCLAGNHVRFGIYRDGVKIKSVAFNYDDIINTKKPDWNDIILIFMQEAIRKNNAVTDTEMKSAIEAIEVNI